MNENLQDPQYSERIRSLMMAALDNECSPAERRELEQALQQNPALQSEWRELQRVKEVSTMMSVRKPPEEVWSSYWAQVYARNERKVAWLLISIGAVVLLSWGLWQTILNVLGEMGLPDFIKVAIGILSLGVVVLAVSVVREKLFVNKHERYKDIER
jgi:ferric-dicitrate binding protein FerR (iron transport regulator)